MEIWGLSVLMKNIDGNLLNNESLKEIKEKFVFVDIDPITQRKRLYLGNARGFFRLKSFILNLGERY